MQVVEVAAAHVQGGKSTNHKHPSSRSLIFSLSWSFYSIFILYLYFIFSWEVLY